MKKLVSQCLLVASLVVGACADEASDGDAIERAQIRTPSVDCDAMVPVARDAGAGGVDAGGSRPIGSDAGIVVMRDSGVVLDPEPEPERDPDCDFLNYESFGQSFFTSYCTDCHTGASAPQGVDLSSLDGIQKNKEEIAEHALGMPSHNPMPPPALPQPAPEERDLLEKYLNCGPN